MITDRFLGPLPRDSDSVFWGVVQSFLSRKLPEDAADDASGLENAFRGPLLFCRELLHMIL